MPFAGRSVTVTGTVYDKGGAHAIVIDKIAGRLQVFLSGADDRATR